MRLKPRLQAPRCAGLAALLAFVFVTTLVAYADHANAAEPLPAEPGGAAVRFKVFQSLSYTGMPDLKARYGILKMAQLNSDSGFFYPPNGAIEAAMPAADAFTMDAYAGNMRSISPDGYEFLDFEEWSRYPWSGDPDQGAMPVTVASADKWALTAQRWRSALDKNGRSTDKFGYYDVLPPGDFWIAVRSVSNPAQFAQWRRANDVVAAKVGPHVDFVAPSLYTYYDTRQTDRDNWVTAAVRVIEEARRVAPGKPVYPFIWPQFHDSSSLAGYYVDPVFWKLQLDTIRQHADGVVIWGGWDVAGTKRPYAWDETAPWWQATKAWLATLK